MTKINQSQYSFLAASIFIGILFLYFPFLRWPLMGDDIFHALIFKQIPIANETYNWLTDLFRFSDGSPGYIQYMKEKAGLLWWANPELKVQFFRPLSAITQKIDYIFWPSSVLMMHLHNVAWYLFSIFLAFLFYKRILAKESTIILSTILFCISIFHIFSVAWIAGRNVLVCACFVLITAIFYIDSIRLQKAFYYYLSILFAGLSLLGGEAGITFLAFVVIYNFFFYKSNLTKKILKLVPFILIVLAYLYFYQHYNFGSFNSGFYTSPKDGLFTFTQTIISRIPEYITLNFFYIKKIGVFKQLSTPVFLLFTVTIVCIFFFLFIKPLIKNKNLQFLLLAYVACIIPFCASEPNMRALFIPSIFSSAILAMVINSSPFNLKDINLRGIFSLLLSGMHIIMPLIAFGFLYFADVKKPFAYLTLSKYLTDNNITSTDSIFVFNNDMNISLSGAGHYLLETNKRPKQLINMLSSNNAFYIEKVNETSIRAASVDKQLLLSHTQDIFGRIHTRADHEFTVGQQFILGDVRIEIESLDAKTKVPNSLIYTFEKPLDSKEYKWIYANDQMEIKTFQLMPAKQKLIFN